ncbi:unnamed protein product [Rotaria magnacalcarata]|uniref:G-protein coupled receptors family 1 profile domain-containing protein n=1 Tax=Rotaria magnacalcarata TaxID=392030 RepID=A0A815N9I5_9BILA|nr:unnamed protein product [Rotaria magnacalcarata]CAF3980486.1 unnamed protein product [Rotaria magnacalcarata]
MDGNATLLEDFHYLNLGNHISTIVLSIIYAFGFMGNIFSVLTFSSTEMRELSCGILLLLLSISDILYLITSWWDFLNAAFNIELEYYSLIGCRFWYFFSFVFGHTSSWCLATLNLDRSLKVQMPTKSKSICTPKKALLFVVLVFIMLCALHGHWFSPAIGEKINGTIIHCGPRNLDYPTYYFFMTKIRSITDLFIYCFLPAVVMIIANITIIYNLRQAHQVISTRRMVMERQMIMMMSSSVAVFLLTTLPFSLYDILMGQVIIKYANYDQYTQYYTFIHRMLGLLNSSHFALNFYLYCLTSRLFRLEFIRRITCGKCDHQ